MDFTPLERRSQPVGKAYSMTDTRPSPEASGRAGSHHPARPTPRIWSNSFGTFHLVASDAYWAARAAMLSRYGQRR